VVNERDGRRSMVLTSNRAPAELAELFRDPLLASATMDRLGHHAILLTIASRSHRLSGRLTAQGKERRASS